MSPDFWQAREEDEPPAWENREHSRAPHIFDLDGKIEITAGLQLNIPVNLTYLTFTKGVLSVFSD